MSTCFVGLPTATPYHNKENLCTGSSVSFTMRKPFAVWGRLTSFHTVSEGALSREAISHNSS